MERKCLDGDLRLILQSAPVLKGCKQSCMLFLTDRELTGLRKSVRKASLSMCVLYSAGSKLLTLLYRKDQMMQCLRVESVRSFLESFGYAADSFTGCLPMLRKRLKQFYEKQTAVYPHEVGIFLGYPLCDVWGFWQHGGKEYLHSGYWKVYDNLEETMERFRAFDLAKAEAVDEWFSGRNIDEIAC